MASNYEDLIARNLAAIYGHSEGMDLENRLPATKDGPFYEFRAFGEACRMGPEEITLSGVRQSGPKGLIISLYALHAVPDPPTLAPLQSFKDIPASVTCLFSSNAHRFIPLDGLADVAEYTTRRIIELL